MGQQFGADTGHTEGIAKACGKAKWKPSLGAAYLLVIVKCLAEPSGTVVFWGELADAKPG